MFEQNMVCAVMPEINDIMAEALSAQPVEDEEQAEEYVETALDFVQSRDSFAVESESIDTIEGEAMEMTTVWNDDLKRTEVPDQPMGGSMEIIIPDHGEHVFVKMPMSPMMNLTETGQHDEMYLCLDQQGMSELTNQSFPEDRDEKVELLRVIKNGKVSVEGNTVFFELKEDTDDLQWMTSSTYKEDVESAGIHSIVTFDLDEGRLDHWFETIRNVDEPNSHSLKEFLYDQSFDFRVPNKEDEDVVEFDGSDLGLGGGGLGGGGLDDVLGDSDGGLDDLIGGLTGDSENPFSGSDDSIF